MLNWIKRNKNGIIRSMFLVPIILVMIISIAHVVSWYDLSNPMSWAIYLSIAIEIAAMSSIAAASVKIRGGVWFVFVIVTLIQFIGNIFFCYKDTDVTSQNFKDWVELTQPVFDALGSDTKDMIGQRRWLALLEGGLLPLISLASLHFFIKYGGKDDIKIDTNNSPEPQQPEGTPLTELPTTPIEDVVTVDQVVNSQQPEDDTRMMEQLLDLQDDLNTPNTQFLPTTGDTEIKEEEISYEEGVRRALEANHKKRAEGTDKWA